MNFYNKNKFNGYKVRPVYLERVNNYLSGVAASQQQDEVEVKEVQPQGNIPHRQQSSVPVEEKKVSIADLRNKRNAIQSNTYNYSNKNTYGRQKASYRVNVSYANGSFQTDGL